MYVGTANAVMTADARMLGGKCTVCYAAAAFVLVDGERAVREFCQAHILEALAAYKASERMTHDGEPAPLKPE